MFALIIIYRRIRPRLGRFFLSILACVRCARVVVFSSNVRHTTTTRPNLFAEKNSRFFVTLRSKISFNPRISNYFKLFSINSIHTVIWKINPYRSHNASASFFFSFYPIINTRWLPRAFWSSLNTGTIVIALHRNTRHYICIFITILLWL